MKHPIKTEIEYLVARAQAETDVVRHILAEVRKEDDYWKEKAAAKMAAFYEHQEKMLTLYAEMKLYYPELASALEEEKAYLNALVLEAKERLERQKV